ncbi:MAG: RNA-directed DNA polymerase [Colwellia sp.]|jgi:RNA-directed DNA polymerase
MKTRQHRIVGYADDILIFWTSKTGAENALKVASNLLEVPLKFKVNERKTHIAHSDTGVKFLGVVIYTNSTSMQEKKLKAFKFKVKQLTKRNGGCNLATVLTRLNPVLRGFVNHFKIASITSKIKGLAGLVRRRLRATQLTLWKTASKSHRRLKQLKYKPPFKRIKMKSWCNSSSPLAHYAMPNSWFDGIGLYKIDKVKTGVIASYY